MKKFTISLLLIAICCSACTTLSAPNSPMGETMQLSSSQIKNNEPTSSSKHEETTAVSDTSPTTSAHEPTKEETLQALIDQIRYIPETGTLELIVPERLPTGTILYLHVSGLLKMGNERMSFHAFEDETENFSWKPGKKYTYKTEPNALQEAIIYIGFTDETCTDTQNETIITIDSNGNAVSIESERNSEPDISPEKIIGTTDNGKYTVFRTGETTGGDGYIDKVASRDNSTGKIVPIGELAVPRNYILTAADSLVVGYYGHLEQYDLSTGQRSAPLAEFDQWEGELKEGDTLLFDTLYDRNNRLFLLLCAPYHEDVSKFENIDLLIYNENWQLLSTVDTSIKPEPGSHGFGPNIGNIELISDRQINIGKAGIRVSY